MLPGENKGQISPSILCCDSCTGLRSLRQQPALREFPTQARFQITGAEKLFEPRVPRRGKATETKGKRTGVLRRSLLLLAELEGRPSAILTTKSLSDPVGSSYYSLHRPSPTPNTDLHTYGRARQVGDKSPKSKPDPFLFDCIRREH